MILRHGVVSLIACFCVMALYKNINYENKHIFKMTVYLKHELLFNKTFLFFLSQIDSAHVRVLMPFLGYI